MEDHDGDSFTHSLVDLAFGEYLTLYYETTEDDQNAITGTFCILLAVLYQKAE